MATGRKRITGNGSYSTEKRKQILEAKKSEFKHPEYDSQNCFTAFIIAQKEKGNSKETISFYKRFYKKYCAYCEALYEKEVENFNMKMLPIEHLVAEMNQMFFMNYLEKQGLNNQTINSYLRGLRSWGNWCEEEGYIEGFKCPIKEVEPPVKEVYSDYELGLLMSKPPIANFAEFRSYCIISLLLNTGARSKTILNRMDR